MKKILAAVDGSLASLHGARLALQIADAMGGEVTLIHVRHPTALPALPVVVPPVALVDLHESDLAAGAALLATAAAELKRPALSTINLVGAPAYVIADSAEAEGFELVVVGHTGKGAVTRVLLGSVADRLVHICKVPVLVAR